ncbi:MAG: thiamine diphosphokinase [Ruminococcaceae bacterium]|nr:thiamine diphosphokinase [Oscillospiraceae bacterium]
MKAFIYTGGRINKQNITEHPKSDDICIAADSGYKNAKVLGEKVDVLLGDFDSIGEPLPDGIKVITVPAEKDFTDTQLAVQTALDMGANEIVIVGGLGGRLDHTLANLGLLQKLGDMRVHAVATDGYNRVRYINGSSTLIAKSQYKYVSVLPIDKKIKGVDIEGCKYPLKNATLMRDDTLAVSNEVTGNCALISVRKGACYIIESVDE